MDDDERSLMLDALAAHDDRIAALESLVRRWLIALGLAVVVLGALSVCP